LPLSTDLFDYELPERLIAQTPSAQRDQSRLLVVDRATRTISHHAFADLPRFLRAGDTLFRNNVAVLPARLRAVRPTGGHIECLLLRPAATDASAGAATADAEETTPDEWWCLLRPGKK